MTIFIAHRYHKRLSFILHIWYEQSEICDVEASQNTQEAIGQDVLLIVDASNLKVWGSIQNADKLWLKMNSHLYFFSLNDVISAHGFNRYL